MNKKNLIVVLAITLSITVIVSVYTINNFKKDEKKENISLTKKNILKNVSAVVYKSAYCGCCAGHIKAMQGDGIKVKVIEKQDVDLNFLKEDKGIKPSLQSCHTTVLTVGDKEYIVEGHVPISAIEKLVKEKPNIKGITLPGMPAGTPGMPGKKIGKFKVMIIEKDPKLYLSV